MKTQNQTMLSENTLTSRPTDIIAGFPVRPGFFELNGATPLSNGVNFTAHTRHGTSCELLLFHSGEEEPFAVLPFPNACRIGDVYSMIVMGLDIEDLVIASKSARVHQRSAFRTRSPVVIASANASLAMPAGVPSPMNRWVATVCVWVKR